LVCFALAIFAVLGNPSQAPRIADVGKKLKASIDNSSPPSVDKNQVPVKPPLWEPRTDGTRYASGQWFDGSGTGSNKREKPLLLAVDGGPKNIQVSYQATTIFKLDLERERAKLRVFETPEVKGGVEV